jgi:hypothetical protein
MAPRIYTSQITVGGVDIYEVTADPDGVLSATRGSLAIRSDTAALYQNTDGGTSWTPFGALTGAPVVILKKQVALGELPANTSYGTFFDSQMPAHKPVFGAFIFVNEAPAGGGVGSCSLTVQTTGGTRFVESQQLVGATNGQYIPILNVNPNAFSGTSMINISSAARDVFYSLNCDVNLDTLTNFDVTAYLIYVDSLTLP